MAWVVDSSVVLDLHIADVMIAAFALRFQGLITRNGTDFRNIAPSLRLVEP